MENSKLVFIKTTKIILKFIITLGIIGWLIKSNYSAFITAAKKIDLLWLIVGIFLYFITIFANAVRWYFLIKAQKIHTHFSYILNLTARSLFFSLIIPLGVISGDIFKIGHLLRNNEKSGRLKVLSTVLVDRFVGMLGQFIVGIIVFLLMYKQILLVDPYLKKLLILIFSINVIGVVAAIALFYHRVLRKLYLIELMFRLMNRMTKGYIDNISEILDNYINAKKTMFYGVIISIFPVQVVSGLILYSIAIGEHLVYRPLGPLMLGMSFGNTVGLLPLTPSGLGTRDTVINAILVNSGYQEAAAISIPILFSIIMIASNIFLGIFFLIRLKR